MPQQPPPPVVTIRDPNAPASLTDVLGEEPRAPRQRLSRLERGLTSLVLATGGAGVWGVGHLHAQQRLDARSVTELRLSAVDPPGLDSSQGTSLELDLRDDGPHPVHVVAARLEDGTRLRAVSNTLEHGRTGTVRFHRPACPTRTPTLQRDSPVDLEVRTYRGLTGHVAVPADSASTLLERYYVWAVEGCRLYPVAASLAPAGQPVFARRGRDLVVLLPVVNRARRPRTLVRVEAGGGVSAAAGSGPRVLAGGQRVTLTVTLRAADCERVRAEWLRPHAYLGAVLSDEPSDALVQLVLSGDDEGEVQEPFLGPGVYPQVDGWLADVCR